MKYELAMPHLFEFMDQDWVPSGLRITLREILECGNSEPFRPYYKQVANEVINIAKHEGLTNLVELGAGTAPITRLLANKSLAKNINLVPCDINPDHSSYKNIECLHPGKVKPNYSSVNFSNDHQWPSKSLLFLSATFHHIPPSKRSSVINSLSNSGSRVVIFEPLRKTLLSILFVPFSLIPALILPILLHKRPGNFRRLLWCWIIPMALPMFLWDGIVSCLRMWSNKKWLTELKLNLTSERIPNIRNKTFIQTISW